LTLKTATGFILHGGAEVRAPELFTGHLKEREFMRRLLTTLAGSALLLLACASSVGAQVGKVEMRIDGYLCGN
jgi:hypothetical protein